MIASAIELDSNGTYVLPVLGKLLPVDLDTHVMSWHINTEDPLPDSFYEDSIYNDALDYEVRMADMSDMRASN